MDVITLANTGLASGLNAERSLELASVILDRGLTDVEAFHAMAAESTSMAWKAVVG